MALLTSSAVPNLSTWVHYSDVTNEVASGNGYATGGVTLTAKTHVQTFSNSWTAWQNTTPYTYGNIVSKPAPGDSMLYMCSSAGTSGGSAPAFPQLVGQHVTDSTVDWTAVGESVTIWSSANAQWTSSTFSAAYGVIYDAQSGTASTEPLICLINFGQTLSPSNGTLTISPDATYGWWLTTPA